ncbi:MAG: HAD family hydrolase [Fervidobacterium sp.]
MLKTLTSIKFSMKTKVIMFDLWNTLIFEKSFDVYKQVVEAFYFRDINDFWRYCQKSVFVKRMSYSDLFKELADVRETSKAKVKYMSRIWKKLQSNIKLFDDSLNVIKKLSKDYRLVLVTNTSYEEANIGLSINDIGRFFSKKVLSCDIGICKPNRGIYEIALSGLDVKPEEVCMVGDLLNIDIIPAKSMGMKTILVDRDNNYKQKPKESDFVVKSLDEIINILSN